MKVQTFEEIATMAAMAALDSGFMISTYYGQQAGQPMPVSDSRTLIRFARAMRHLGMIEAAKIADNCDKSTHPADVAEAIREAVRVEG